MRTELSTESLGRWARRCGISYRTAWRWFRANRLPEDVVAQQMPTGTILIRDGRLFGTRGQVGGAVIYARVDPRQDPLAQGQQVESCRSFCVARGWTIKRIVREVAPGGWTSARQLTPIDRAAYPTSGRSLAFRSQSLRLSTFMILFGDISIRNWSSSIGRRRSAGVAAPWETSPTRSTLSATVTMVRSVGRRSSNFLAAWLTVAFRHRSFTLASVSILAKAAISLCRVLSRASYRWNWADANRNFAFAQLFGNVPMCSPCAASSAQSRSLRVN